MKKLLALAVLLAGCSGGSEEEAVPPGAVTFAQVQAVLDQHCVTCHYGNALDLGGPGTRERLLTQTTMCFEPNETIERPVVAPGDPAGSSLWHKIANIDLTCGREMPMTGQGGLIAMDPDSFDLIERWIEAGAPE